MNVYMNDVHLDDTHVNQLFNQFFIELFNWLFWNLPYFLLF